MKPKLKLLPKFAGRGQNAGKKRKRSKHEWIRKKKQSPPSPPWTELPPDVTANILHRLKAVEILENAQIVCTTWRSVCKDPSMWRVIDMSNSRMHDMPYDLEKMFRHAVDRSQGQLVDINLEYFATDESLDYIVQRSRQLRCLRLTWCYGISDEGLVESVKRFPQLEELHIILTSIEDIEMIGHSCPSLKSFTFNSMVLKDDCRGNEEAFAIARSMPELRHLQLVGNGLTNEGLQAILDGCPLLESLDLRRCDKVKLVGDLGKRGSKQIKHLRYPNDSTADYEYQVEEIDDPPFPDPDDYFWCYM